MLALTPGANPRRPFRRYAVAVLAALVVVGVHLLLHRRFGPSFDPFFLVVVGLSAWYGGFGPGLVTLVASGLGALLTTIPPAGSLRLTSRVDALGLMAYGVSGLVINGLIASILAARRRAEAAREQVAFLAEVSEVLASSLDYRSTLPRPPAGRAPPGRLVRRATWWTRTGGCTVWRSPTWTRRRSSRSGP